MPGHADVHAAVVTAVAVRHGADKRIAIGHARELRQQLADTGPGNAGGDGAIRPANVLRRVGLEVPAIVMAGPAILDDEDARFLAA